jgi:hypothetical protein
LSLLRLLRWPRLVSLWWLQLLTGSLLLPSPRLRWSLLWVQWWLLLLLLWEWGLLPLLEVLPRLMPMLLLELWQKRL